MRAAIQTQGLSKSFGPLKAVEDLNLSVYPAEVFGLLGPNGAGKTTTMRMLMTLLRPTAGRAEVFGYDLIKQPKEIRRLIGYVPQEKSVDRFMTGREHLRLMAALYHLPRAEAKRRIAEVLEIVGLADRADELVGNYSGGMKKKLDIACGLVGHPRIMFMDEPSLGLDVESRLRIWEHIRSLRKNGITIFLSTNYLDEADQLCDRLAVMDRGRIVAVGSPTELKKGLRQDRILIELGAVANEASEQLVKTIQEFDFVRDVRRQNGQVEVWIDPQQDAFAVLFQNLSRGHYPVQAIHYMRPSLEEVFIRYTGHRIQDNSHG